MFAVMGTVTLSSAAAGQATRTPGDAIAPTAGEMFAMLDVLTGTERDSAVTRRMRFLLGPGWTQDALGSWTRVRGSGRPHRVVACALDRPGYVVSEITDDGYLRLHDAAVSRGQRPLWDQFHEGQRVRVTMRAPVAETHVMPGEGLPGVIGVRSTHLYRRRALDSTRATPDGFYVDIGASSRTEAERLGVRLLAPVAREWEPFRIGSHASPAGNDEAVIAPALAQRMGCGAVLAASAGAPTHGQTTFVLAAQSAYNMTGLAAVLARIGAVDSLVLVGPAFVRAATAASSAVAHDSAAPAVSVPGGRPPSAVIGLTVRARYAGTLAETVRLADAAQLGGAVARAAGVSASTADAGDVRDARSTPPRWIPARGLPTTSDTSPPLHRESVLLGALADAYGVSGHENTVRDTVRALLPAWARSRARIDSAGNLVIAVGPERDTVAIVAHLDEIGFAVTRVAPDGTVALRSLGGFYRSLWEGQPALLHRDGAPPLRGIFVPRDSARTREPTELTAWFGVDSAALVALGVRPGMAVTGVKSAARLGAWRFTARSSDDRTGCAALLLAMSAIEPAHLTHKVVFAFTTREEIGLEGAAALAAELGPNVRRVYAVDTFVTSDAPLESHRFAYAPLGAGAVVRAVDNSSAAPLDVVDEVVALARRAGIPVQVGTTNGGNDGSAFARVGAIDVPLSWPGRYSHSPVEVLDLRDLHALAELIAALAQH